MYIIIEVCGDLFLLLFGIADVFVIRSTLVKTSPV